MRTANLRIDVITTFIAIVEAGTMREAGRRLGLSKSVVSQRLSTLESALNVSLLSRSTRHLALTESGRFFYDRCQGVIEDLHVAAEEVSERQGQFTGTIRLSAPASFTNLHLLSVLADFMRQHPMIDLQIESDDRARDLVGDPFDVAVRIGQLKDSCMIARRFGASKKVVVCSRRYVSDHGKPDNLDELEDHYAVGNANIAPQLEWSFQKGPEIKSAPPKIRLRVNSGEMQLAAAKEGVALAALPLFIAHQAIVNGDVHVLDLQWDLLPDDLFIVYPQNRFLSRKVRALSEAIIGHIGRPPLWEDIIASKI